MAATRYVYSGATETYDGKSWTTAYRDLAECDGNITAGDTILVASDHNKNYSGATTVTIPNSCLIISVNRTSGVYEAATSNGDYTSSSAYTFTMSAGILVHVYGVALGSTANYFSPSANHGSQLIFSRCTIYGHYHYLQYYGTPIDYNGCTLNFNNASGTAYLFYEYGPNKLTVRNATFASLNAAKNTLAYASAQTDIRVYDTDLSAFSTIVDMTASIFRVEVILERCRVHASVAAADAFNGPSQHVVLRECASAEITATPLGLHSDSSAAGTVSFGAAYLSATDGENQYSLKFAAGANCSKLQPLQTINSLAIWHPGSDASPATATLTIKMSSDDGGLDDSEVYAHIRYGDTAATTYTTGDRISTQSMYGAEAAADTSTYLKSDTADWIGSGPATDYKIVVTGIEPQEPCWVYVDVFFAVASKSLWVCPKLLLTT